MWLFLFADFIALQLLTDTTMSVHKSDLKKITTHQLQNMKERGEKISMLTAYDFSMASILDAAGTDVLLVGDSASNVMAGHETTLPITLDQMIYHIGGAGREPGLCGGGHALWLLPG